MEQANTRSLNDEPTFIEDSPRIPPIEYPKSFKLRLAYWLNKKQAGKIITPLKVVQTRIPETLFLSQKL
jgi:hypothetical protein